MARDQVESEEVMFPDDFRPRIYAAIPAVHTDHKPFLPKVEEAILTACGDHYVDFYVGEVNNEGLGVFVDSLNECIDHVLKKGYDYFWFVESDVVVPPDALTRLLAHNVDVAAGVVPYHKIAPVYENLMVVGRFLSAGSYRSVNLHKADVLGKIITGNIFAGTGCVLTKKRVWENGLRFMYKNELAGLDMIFWKAVKIYGFDILADGNVLCEDLG